MCRFTFILLVICFQAFANEFSDSGEIDQRFLEEAMEVVEKSQKERRDFEHVKSNRKIASDEEINPEFQKDFEKMIEELD